MRTASDRWLPFLLVLPAFLFATSLSPLARDPYPHLAGMGWSVWALVPLALLVAVRGAPLLGALPFLLGGLWGLGLLGHPQAVTDTFERTRALCVLALLPLALAGGAALDARGRRSFAGLLVLLSGLWTAQALATGWFEGVPLAGLLGDTGSLSQAALPGAAVAAFWVADRRGVARVAGTLVLGLFLVHVAAAPVLAGSHTLLAALGIGAARLRGHGRGTLAALAAAALMAPFFGMAGRELAGHAPTVMEGAPSHPSHSLSGLGVRAAVWTSAGRMLVEHPVHGVGPGQFQAAFPPYRDAREIELSRHGVCSELDTEVEHAHNDWLWPWLEFGIVGGLLFGLGFVMAGERILAALREAHEPDLAIAGLALLVNALVHAPLSANPGSCVLALALWGSLYTERRNPAGRLLALPLLLAAVFCAAPLVRHGRALRDYVAAVAALEDGPDTAATAARARAAAQRALAVAPDSVPARLLAARLASADPAAWDRVLELRPHAVEALEGCGTAHALRAELEPARRRYEEALELSPTHPRLLRNLLRLESTLGDATRARAVLERLQANGCLEARVRQDLGRELVLAFGRARLGAELLLERPLEELSPEALHAAAREAQDPLEGDALECLAQLLWARQNAAAGAFEVALRNYRQVLERSRAYVEGAAAPYRWEFHAAELGAAAAPPDAPETPLDARARAELPAWAQAVLDRR